MVESLDEAGHGWLDFTRRLTLLYTVLATERMVRHNPDGTPRRRLTRLLMRAIRPRYWVAYCRNRAYVARKRGTTWRRFGEVAEDKRMTPDPLWVLDLLGHIHVRWEVAPEDDDGAMHASAVIQLDKTEPHVESYGAESILVQVWVGPDGRLARMSNTLRATDDPAAELWFTTEFADFGVDVSFLDCPPTRPPRP